ncbi:hypothetical protein DFH09DRAFT_1371392 [Mycena vulgaris]|nr:hypothetical protein DFH09DRAFT_1371392 [Mycena vulgaris]
MHCREANRTENHRQNHRHWRQFLRPRPAETTVVAVLLDHASAAISPEEVDIASALRFPLASFIEDEDDVDDLPLIEYLTPQKQGKGEGPSPAPAPAPASPATRLNCHPPNSCPNVLVSGRRRSFVDTTTKPRAATSTVHDRVADLEKMLAEGLEGVDARFIGFAADHAEGSCGPAHPASNKLAENATAMGAVVNDTETRTRKLEVAAASAIVVTALQAQVESQGRTLQAILVRISALTGSAPPAPSDHDAGLLAGSSTADDARLRAMVQEVVNQNGKRGRGGDDDDAAPKRQQLAVIHCACSTRRVGGPPRVRIDPAREVLFGPMTWAGNCHFAPRNLIIHVLGANNIRAARFTSRKGPDDFTAVLVFEADAVASWFVTTWNDSPRAGYKVCLARPTPLMFKDSSAPSFFYTFIHAVDGATYFTYLRTLRTLPTFQPFPLYFYAQSGHRAGNLHP